MGWENGGLVYAPDGSQWWARSHCHLPTPYLIRTDTLRVYFAALDENKYGRIGFVELDSSDPGRVRGVSPEPVLDLGELGAFDDSGVVPSSIVQVGEHLFLYYVGFQRAARTPYMLFTGLATASLEGRAFTRWSRVPVLDRTGDEPFSRGAPWVLQEQGAFRMWYWSCLRWSDGERGAHYNNVIRSAASDDGLRWYLSPDPCLEPEFNHEYSLGRPSVVRDDGLYRMWYSVRFADRPDGIGYAESPDGHRWMRRDASAELAPSSSGWDSEMVCYPAVVDVGPQRYLFYNGNRRGATGFGYARWVDE